MAIPRTSPVPVPPEELRRAREQLAPYGSMVWEDQRSRVLLVRVPGHDPDPVNDIEDTVDYLSPGDVHGLTHCLLIGDRRMEAVYAQPLRDLMAVRVTFDQEECRRLRQELAPHEHRFYTSPQDPKRLLRLALRLGRESVHGLDDADLEALTETLGPELVAGQGRGVRAVYLVAENDDVRIDPAVLLPDLEARWQDEDRRRRVIAEREREREDVRLRREAERRRLLRDLDRRFGEADRFRQERVRTVRAPMRRGSGQTLAPASPERGAPERAPFERAPPEPLQMEPDPVPAPRDGLPPLWQRVRQRLQADGYEVLVRPPAPGHTVDLAAERAEGHPQRVLVRFPDRLVLAEAEAMLAAARDLGADLALAVTEHADPEAQRRLVATKGRWLTPHGIDDARF